jgi:DNA-binding GntR family transcriptional regulator
VPLREFSELLYYQTTRIWLKMASRLRGYEQLLRNEFLIFQREVADITEAVENGDLAAAGRIRSAHIAMSFERIRRASAAARQGQAEG